MADEYRITHALAEVLRAGDPDARITHALVEVLRANEYTFGNTFDSVSVAEDITVTVESGVTDLSIDVVDDVAVEENISFSFLSIVSINDTLLVGEDVSFSFESFISVTDSVGISEDLSLLVALGISVVDTVELSEDVQRIFEYLIVSVYNEVSIVDIPILVLEAFEDPPDNGDEEVGNNLRYIIPNNKIKQSGNNVRLSLAYSSTTWSFVSVYIGHKAGSGDVYDFDGSQKKVTFGGQSAGTVTYDEFLSDWILFDLDKTKDLIISLFFDETQQVPIASLGSNYNCYGAGGVDESAITDVTDYTQLTNATKSRIIDAIYVASDEISAGLVLGVHSSVGVAEDISAALSDLAVTVNDAVSVAEDVSFAFTGLTISLGLAHGSSAPYDYFSLDDLEVDPITVQVELDQTGGDVESDYVLIYLIADDSFDLVAIEIQSEDAGVEWKISETDSDYGDSIEIGSVTAGAYPVYAKAIVANDGTITADQISANFKVIAW